MTTNADIQLLHLQPHYEELFLSIYCPTTLFSGQVNSSGTSQGAMEIPFSSISGSSANIFHNSVLLVGTTYGASDVGRVRIRGITGSNLYVAENSDIPWQYGLYLTALNYVDLNPIYPRIVEVTGTTDVIFYKDYDIEYTDQNSILGAFPCAGPHRAVFISGSNAAIYWDATGSNHVKGESLSYSWEFEGGTPSTYAGKTPGYVTYDTPGHYKTKLNVSGTSSCDTTYRFVSVYPRAANGDAIPPFQRWSMSQVQGGRSEGGYSVNFKVYDNIDSIYDGALVILFTDQTTYGTTKTTIGSPLKFVGYIQKGTIVYDYQNSCVEFTARSATEVLKDIEAFSISLKSVASPSTWFELENMTIPRALYHYLKWHSTVLDCTDFQYTGDARVFQFWDTDRNSIYDALTGLLSKGLIAELTSDRLGKMWSEISAGAVHNASSVLPVNMSINKQDWMGEPNIEEAITKLVSTLELGGVVFDGVNTSTALLSLAPGFAPGSRGKINRIEGFIGTSQAQMNEVCGDYWAYLTARYSVTLKMAGNYNNIDIAPIQQFQMNVAKSDTVRGIEWVNKPFHPIQMDWSYDAQNGSIYPVVKFAEITNGLQGTTEAVATAQTIDIPAIPPIDIPIIPPIVIPPFPILQGGPNTWTFSISNPAVGTILGPRLSEVRDVIRVDAIILDGTSVTLHLETRSVIGTEGSHILNGSLVADTSGVAAITLASYRMLTGTWLVLNITDVQGSPTELSVTLTTVPVII